MRRLGRRRTLLGVAAAIVIAAGAAGVILVTTARSHAEPTRAGYLEGVAAVCRVYGPKLDQDFADMTRFAYFMRTKKPIIAAINGPAAGMGLIMALYADIRFAADKAVLTTAFAQRGLIAEHGISWLLPKLVGPAHALDLLLSARRISGKDAEQIGLVNRAFPQESFAQDVQAYARLLADTVSPRSMAVMKAQVWKSCFQNFGEALATADAEMPPSFQWPDFKEGVSHFLEKRAPKFADI